MSRLLSRVANSITSRQIFVKCVIQVGQPPFLQRFRRSVGHPPPVLNNVRAILSFFTCRRRPDVSGTPQHATQNFFAKNSSLASFSQRIRFHTRKNHPQPSKTAMGGCFFFMPVYSALRQRRGQGASARRQGRLQIRTSPPPCPPRRCTHQSVRRVKEP